MKNFRPARKTIDVSVGESVRIIRELQGHSQNELSKLTRHQVDGMERSLLPLPLVPQGTRHPAAGTKDAPAAYPQRYTLAKSLKP